MKCKLFLKVRELCCCVIEVGELDKCLAEGREMFKMFNRRQGHVLNVKKKAGKCFKCLAEGRDTF